MKETIIQEPFELKFCSEASTIMNGEIVIQTEELVKINEEGDRALLRLIVPAKLAMEKTFKITIASYGDQILDNDFQNTAQLDN